LIFATLAIYDHLLAPGGIIVMILILELCNLFKNNDFVLVGLYLIILDKRRGFSKDIVLVFLIALFFLTLITFFRLVLETVLFITVFSSGCLFISIVISFGWLFASIVVLLL